MVMVMWLIKIFSPQNICGMTKAKDLKILYTGSTCDILAIGWQNVPGVGMVMDKWLFKSWEVSDNISEMVQNRDIGTMED